MSKFWHHSDHQWVNRSYVPGWTFFQNHLDHLYWPLNVSTTQHCISHTDQPAHIVRITYWYGCLCVNYVSVCALVHYVIDMVSYPASWWPWTYTSSSWSFTWTFDCWQTNIDVHQNKWTIVEPRSFLVPDYNQPYPAPILVLIQVLLMAPLTSYLDD